MRCYERIIAPSWRRKPFGINSEAFFMDRTNNVELLMNRRNGETMKLHKFTIKDIIFIAIMAAALVLAGVVVMPLIMSTSLFGLRNMASAILYSVLTIIALMKVQKIGTLTLLGVFHGFVLLMMTPVMFFNMVIGSFVSELMTWIIFKSYESDRAKVFATTMFIPMTLPTTFIFTMLIHGKSVNEILDRPIISLVLCLVTVILSYIGTKLGQRLGRELQKAGKI